ncbi:FAD-linked oxidase C-terminal domain-containing protein [Enterococcus cecorum]|uniref:FAD-binding oxidoreductase n=1 Tax=Enterococcus cecorum TaxID=44008 RepID=UPI002ACA2AF0|nr:FAD-linked oxidase C-terminal domain-containing protein [Enterococcus cecorum]MDZ5601013.1 FAD-linked oxidase C-terminal domain-containing protein [Enterococcus cecorum]
MSKEQTEIISFLNKNNVNFDVDYNEVFGYDAYLNNSVPRMVVYPKNVKEFISVIQMCKTAGEPFLIRAGSTNYVGSVVPQNGEIVISTLRMEKNFGKINRVENALSGVSINISIDELKKVCEPNYMFPPDPASKNVATLGGAISMNAGGAYCFKYGVTKNYVRKLNILSDNEIMEVGASNIYAASNYPLKDLVIGSEGTLVPILEADVKIIPMQKYEEIMIIEFIDYRPASDFVLSAISSEIPFSAIDMAMSPFFPNEDILPVTSIICSIESNSSKELIKFLTKVQELAIEYGGKIKQEEDLHKERLEIVRRNVGKVRKNFPKYTYFLFDAVIPRTKLREMLDFLYELARHTGLPFMNTYHAGDGNIHPTIYYNSQSKKDIKMLKLLMFIILNKSISLGGTITGEHGIGTEKAKFQKIIVDKEIYQVYKNIKKFFDPQYLMNYSKLVLMEEDVSEYLEEIEYFANIQEDSWFREQIRIVKNVNYHPNLLDGLVVLDEFQNFYSLLKNGYYIPYFPILGHSYPLINLIKLGVPSFFDGLYEIQNYITQIENNKLKYGATTLKNVSGYNLIGMLLKYSSRIKNITVKTLLPSYIDSQIELISLETLDIEDKQLLMEIIVNKNDKIEKYGVIQTRENRQTNLKFKELVDFKNKFYILSSSKNWRKAVLEKFQNYILINKNTLLVQKLPCSYMDLVDEFVLSIREVDLKSGLEKEYYQSNCIKKQSRMQEKLRSEIDAIL